MGKIINVLRVLTAGAFGGLINSLAIWLFGMLGITPGLGFNYVPPLTMAWLMPRLVPSALWGLLFLLPFWQTACFRKGALLSIPLWLVMILVVFPKQMAAGMLGLKLGAAAPVWALFFTQMWGLAAALWLQYVWKEGQQ